MIIGHRMHTFWGVVRRRSSFSICPGGPPELRANYGFNLRDLNSILEQLQRVVERLCEAWNRIHGVD
jgi:hypothetical protein